MKGLKGLKKLPVGNENGTGGCGGPVYSRRVPALPRLPLFESLNHESAKGRIGDGAKSNKFFAFSPTRPLTRLRFII